MKSTLFVFLLALGLASGQAMASVVYDTGDQGASAISRDDGQDGQEDQDGRQGDHRQDGDQNGDQDQKGDRDHKRDHKKDEYGQGEGQHGGQHGGQECEPPHGKDKHRGMKDPKCEPRRLADFNVACAYALSTAPHGFQSCKVNVRFSKAVTLDGGEVADHSPEPGVPLSSEVPELMVECDNVVRFNDHARRFTDLLSTRIQGLSGPRPAIYLPRGSLHEGFHVADSYLEIEPGLPGDPVRMPGRCSIWTGRP